MWFSADKGRTWYIVSVTSGSSLYGASYSSCLGVRYTSPTTKTLVLYSGQIYQTADLQSANFVSGGGLGPYIPVPSVYALTFTLTFSNTVPSQTGPAAVIPVTGQTTYNFQMSIASSTLNQFLTGEYWSLCVSGVLITSPNVQFMGTTPGYVYQFVTNTGANTVRVFSNQTFTITQSVNGIVPPMSGYTDNLLFLVNPVHVDIGGIAFNSPGPVYLPQGQTFVTLTNYTAFASPEGDDTFATFYEYYTSLLDGNAISSSSILSTGSVAACPAVVTTAPALPVVPPYATLPVITGVVGSVQLNGMQEAAGETLNVFISIYGTNFGYPFCTITATWLNVVVQTDGIELNPDGSLEFAFAQPQPPNTTWVSVFVTNLNGTSNSYPGFLFSSSFVVGTSKAPPAIFSVAGSNCASIYYISGKGTVGGQTCAPNSVITITGSFFTSNTAVTIGGTSCSSLSYDSSTQLRCTLPTITTTANNSVTIIATDGGYTSNYYTPFALNANTAKGQSSAATHMAAVNFAPLIMLILATIFISTGTLHLL